MATTSIGSDGVTFPDGTVLSGPFPDATRSMAKNGYQIFPSGIIHQWGVWEGTLSTSGNGGTTPQFAAPMKFPNTTLQLVGVAGFTEITIITQQVMYSSDDGVVFGSGWSNTATQTLLQFSVDGLGSTPGLTKIRWYAIGY